MTQQADPEAFDDEVVVAMYAAAQQEAAEAQERAGRLEQELQRRATERGATVIHGDGMDYKIENKKEYDRTQLRPLVEFLTPIQKGKCIIPAHMKEVPEAYDMTQWNKAGRENGAELQEGLDALTFAGKAVGKLVQT